MLGVGWVTVWGLTALAWCFVQPLWLLALLPLFVGWVIWQRQSLYNAKLAPLEKELQALERIQNNKDELLAMVSHELRTPMNVVMGLHPRIREGLAHDPRALDLLDQMHGAAEGLLQVFKSILDTSQREACEGVEDELRRLNLGAVTNLADALHPWRIVVVDDNPVNVLVVRLMLEKIFPNAQLSVAHSAHEAMQQLVIQTPHVVLLDVWMPAVDGYALTRWVRQHSNTSLASVPIIAITGTRRPEDAGLRDACGMDDVLYKPVDEQQLRLRISSWLPTNRSQQGLT